MAIECARGLSRSLSGSSKNNSSPTRRPTEARPSGTTIRRFPVSTLARHIRRFSLKNHTFQAISA